MAGLRVKQFKLAKWLGQSIRGGRSSRLHTGRLKTYGERLGAALNVAAPVLVADGDAAGYVANPTTFSGSSTSSPAGVWVERGRVKISAEDLSASPYEWTQVPLGAEGVGDFTAVSRSTAGALARSAVVVEIVDSLAPTGAMTAPANLATVSGVAVTVSASAADAGSGVASVQFQKKRIGTDADFINLGTADVSAPYSIVWDTTSGAGMDFPNDDYQLRAEVTDGVGNVGLTAARTVTVNN